MRTGWASIGRQLDDGTRRTVAATMAACRTGRSPDLTLDQLDELIRRTKQLRNGSSAVTVTDVAGRFRPSLPIVQELRFAPRDGGNEPGARAVFSDQDAVHAAMPRLRRVLDSIDVPDDGPVRSMAELAADIRAMIEHRVQARYVPLAWRVPDLT